MRWAEEQRINFIVAHLAERGSIRRSDLIEKFGISVPQASKDLTTAQGLHPGLMVYNKTAKRYEAAERQP